MRLPAPDKRGDKRRLGGIVQLQCTSNCSFLEAEEVEVRRGPLPGVQWGGGEAWEAGGNLGRREGGLGDPPSILLEILPREPLEISGGCPSLWLTE